MRLTYAFNKNLINEYTSVWFETASQHAVIELLLIKVIGTFVHWFYREYIFCNICILPLNRTKLQNYLFISIVSSARKPGGAYFFLCQTTFDILKLELSPWLRCNRWFYWRNQPLPLLLSLEVRRPAGPCHTLANFI